MHIKQVFSPKELDVDLGFYSDYEGIIKQKVADAGLAYCERAYPGEKIVVYYTDGVQSLYSKNGGAMAELWVGFEDGRKICVGARAPGYTMYRVLSASDEHFLEKGGVERIFNNTDSIWMDER